MNETQNTPELRFEGFTEPWRRQKLGDISDIRTGSSDVQDAVEGGRYPFFIRSDEVIRSNKYVFDCEAILTPGEGRIGEVFHYCNGKFDCHQRVYKISDFKNVEAKFVLYDLQHSFKKHAMRNTVKATVDSLRLPTLMDFELVAPKSVEEQRQIASLFWHLDDSIALYRRRYKRLQRLKQALLRKMFPKPGEQVPELRFEGFTEPWEQRKFKDIVTIERGGSPRPIEDFVTDSPNGLNWVKIGDAPSLGRYITRTAEKIRPEGLSKTRQVYPGDLILSNSMSFGRPYIMAIEGCIHDGWLLIRDTTKQLDPIYLCQMLGTPQMFNQYRSLAAGSTVNNLNKELVGNAVVPIPCKEEQKVIGKVLDDLDNLVILHQHKYERLQHLKQALLRKMFI
ncbi:restriction endonuclease subunit S [Bifidobacterium pseudolongum]|uniref:restriction endonuclease subunit S n=1 Tax=Bifidobacterium pseudolongum TaxID=1694 RepID=UPI0010E24AEF|nr:restriction endonuclease subunit S [Bifidobacterium pseudolongum]RYQ00525.1 type I restriction-modification system, subunit S [Bifidobacterium pseudolongum subsp. globosum]